jgi:periplasmic protein CpxP/Spy
MNLTAEQREQVANEVKRFAADLNLTPDQKEKLQTAFQDAREKLGDYMKEHPGVTKADIVKEVAGHRDQIRQRVVNFLNPANSRSGMARSPRPISSAITWHN